MAVVADNRITPIINPKRLDIVDLVFHINEVPEDIASIYIVKNPIYTENYLIFRLNKRIFFVIALSPLIKPFYGSLNLDSRVETKR